MSEPIEDISKTKNFSPSSRFKSFNRFKYNSLMDATLYDAVIRGDVEGALRATCQCLIQERWAALEETWVRLVGLFGEKLYQREQATPFYRMAVELTRLLQQDDLPVKQALLYSAKLLLVFKRPYLAVGAAGATRANLQRLRSRIIQYFPPDAQLTRSGKMKFQRFLPTDPEEAAFAERIIAGLLQLCESSVPPGDLKEALEYLARKKLVLYTAPYLKNPEAPGAGAPPDPEDLVPYLWMILKIIKPLSFDETIETMYYHGYKTSLKNTRLGFLYAMAFLSENAASSVEPLWSPTEQVLLDKVLENALVLWKEAKAPPPVEPEPEEPLFIPIRPTTAAQGAPTRLDVEDEKPSADTRKKVKKTIHITRGKGRNRLGRKLDLERGGRDGGDTDDFQLEDVDLEEETAHLRGFQIKDYRRKKKEDVPHRDSSGHRGVYIDKAGSRI
jgi:hypothetical protein